MERNEQKLNMPGGFKSEQTGPTNYSVSNLASDLRDTGTTERANLMNKYNSKDYDPGLIEDRVRGQRNSLTGAVLTGASTAATGAAAAGASVIAAAKKLISNDDDDYDEIDDGRDTPADGIHAITNQNTAADPATMAKIKIPISKDHQGLEFTKSPAIKKPPVSPGDRMSDRVNIHAMKPSDKAIYGGLDTPGAHHQPGPLSEKVLAGTTPINPFLYPKTIADPLGPVKVANWNDGRRLSNSSNVSSEDFETQLDQASKNSSSKAGASGDAGITPLRDHFPASASTNVGTQSPRRSSAPAGMDARDAKASMGAAAMTTASTGAVAVAALHHHNKDDPSSSATDPPATSVTAGLEEKIENAIDKVKSFFQSDKPHPVPKDNTFQVASTDAMVLLGHQEYHSRNRRTAYGTPDVLGSSHPYPARFPGMVPIHHTTATIAASSASPEVFLSTTDYVPERALQSYEEEEREKTQPKSKGGMHLPHWHKDHKDAEDPMASRDHGSNIPALATAAAVGGGTAAGAAAFLRRRTSGEPEEEPQSAVPGPTIHHVSQYGPADPRRLPLTNPGTVRPLEGEVDPKRATIAAETCTPDTCPEMTGEHLKVKHDPSEYGPADPHQLDFTNPASLRSPAVAPIPAPRRSKVGSVNRNENPQSMDPSRVDPMDPDSHSGRLPKAAVATAAVAGTGAAIGAASHHRSKPDPVDSNGLQFSDPSMVRPLDPSEVRPGAGIVLEQHSTENLGVKHHPSEYGPADPSQLGLAPLSPPHPTEKSAGRPSKAGVVAATTAGVAATGAAVGAAAQHEPKTDSVDPKEHSTGRQSKITPAVAATTAAVAGTGAALGVTAAHRRPRATDPADLNELQFTDPSTVSPLALNETRPGAGIALEPHPTENLNVRHHPSEYGPADPSQLGLAAPSTGHKTGMLPKAAAAGAVAAGTGAAIGAAARHGSRTDPAGPGELEFTDPTRVRPLDPNESRMGAGILLESHPTENLKIKHHPSEYGPADPSHLELTTPPLPDKSTGHHPKAAAVAATTAGVAAAGTGIGAAAIQHRSRVDPTDSSKLEFTDPSTVRPLGRDVDLDRATISAETCTPDACPKATGEHLRVRHDPSEYGPADPRQLHLTDPASFRPVVEPPKEDNRHQMAATAAAGTAAAAATGAAVAATRPRGETVPDPRVLQFTDPSTVRPLGHDVDLDRATISAETCTPEACPKLTGEHLRVKHDPSEYGPADPRQLHLTDPATFRPAVEHRDDNSHPKAAAAAAVTAAGVATGAAVAATRPRGETIPDPHVLQFTDPSTVRPLGHDVDLDRATISAETCTPEACPKLTGEHLRVKHDPSEYGPADPRHLHLTDPASFRPAVEPPKVDNRHRMAATTAAAGTAAVAATGAAIAHNARSGPTDPHTLQFTDPSTVRPLGRDVDLGRATISAETCTPEACPKLTGEHLKVKHSSSEYGPADPRHLALTDPRSLLPEAEIHGIKTTTTTNEAPAVHSNAPKAAAVGAALAVPAAATAAAIHHKTEVTPPHLDARAGAGVGASAVASSSMATPGITTGSTEIPTDYSGPIPKVQPGEEIVWIKTITTTQYFDDNKGGSSHSNQPDHFQGGKQHRSFLDRLMGRRSTNNKGKQRV